MNRKTLIFGGVAILVFLMFLVLLFAMLGRESDSQVNTQVDQNRAPSKAQIENTARKFVPTTGPSPTESPIDLDYSQRIDDDDQIDASQLETSPETYLFNKLPYGNARFSMTADLVDGGGGAITFTVLAKENAEDARLAAIAWMESIKLQRSVIDSLDISYPQ